jgi:UDP-N-acetylglucosamine--N-acetylmuramyl-(pentapeptide) pyrophosphoryl-undecaprenol N-acetylglucosamine transferase
VSDSPTILLAGGGTGGHVFPLLAVADALREIAPDVHVVFVGTERGMEAGLVPKRGYELALVHVRPIRGGGISGAISGIWRAAASFPESGKLLRKHTPSAVVSIGGYAAGPVSLRARARGIPLSLIEPNAVMGLSNRLIAPIVQRGYTAFSDAERHFRTGRALRTGVPIRLGFQPRPYARDGETLRVLVLGGSQGAKSLNETVPEALANVAKVASKLSVTHQCGALHAANVSARYGTLQPAFPFRIVPFIDDMPGELGRADLVISRSGASAVSEIAAIGRPAVYVPYPFAAGDHQRKNAESMAGDGAAVCVDASEANAERMAQEIQRLARDPDLLARMAARAAERGRPNAAYDIARDVLGLAGLGETSARRLATVVASGKDDGGGLASSLVEAR